MKYWQAFPEYIGSCPCFKVLSFSIIGVCALTKQPCSEALLFRKHSRMESKAIFQKKLADFLTGYGWRSALSATFLCNKFGGNREFHRPGTLAALLRPKYLLFMLLHLRFLAEGPKPRGNHSGTLRCWFGLEESQPGTTTAPPTR
jgi:hypothetical protein